MTQRADTNISYIASFIFHVLILLLFYFWKINTNFEVSEFVTIGFGSGSASSSSGIMEAKGFELPEESNLSSDVQKQEKVDLPTAKNEFDENLSASDKINKEKISSPNKEVNKKSDSQKGNMGLDEGGLGFDIEWGGGGIRKIYSYSLPSYPAGVNKEIDIRLRFSILPDGSVGNILPLTKGDTRLENAAINSLRQWKFEPLRANQKQVEQFAVIVFPYRLQ